MSFVLAFLLFAILHTFLANNRIKYYIIKSIPGIRFYYRLFYNIISILSLGVVWFFAPITDSTIYTLNGFPAYVFHFIQLIALILLLRTVAFFGGGSFTGFKQVTHHLTENKPEYHLDEPASERFIATGPYTIVRHPLYFFSVIILIFHPYMTLKWLVFTVCSILYFWLGSIPEERKLIERFGTEYVKYQQQVPRLIPFRLFKRHV